MIRSTRFSLLFLIIGGSPDGLSAASGLGFFHLSSLSREPQVAIVSNSLYRIIILLVKGHARLFDRDLFICLEITGLLAGQLPDLLPSLNLGATKILDLQSSLGDVVQKLAGVFLDLSGLHQPEVLGYFVGYSTQRSKDCDKEDGSYTFVPHNHKEISAKIPPFKNGVKEIGTNFALSPG